MAGETILISVERARRISGLLDNYACTMEWGSQRRLELLAIIGDLDRQIAAAEELQRTPLPCDLTATGYTTLPGVGYVRGYIVEDHATFTDGRKGTEHSLQHDTLWEVLEAECRDAPRWEERDGRDSV